LPSHPTWKCTAALTFAVAGCDPPHRISRIFASTSYNTCILNTLSKEVFMSEQVHVVCPHCDAVNRMARERLADQPVCGKCAQPLFVGMPLDVSSERFAKHVGRNDIPVVVDFWAAWCGPCKMMAPAYAQAAQRLEPAARLLKVDTENAQDLAARFNIRSIPTLALFRGGREIARQAGAMDAASIVRWVEANS
jgi:thioredoxin 2